MHSREELIPRLSKLYQAIDTSYSKVIEENGFSCIGCDGVKCCTVDLNLHTYMERFLSEAGIQFPGW